MVKELILKEITSSVLQERRRTAYLALVALHLSSRVRRVYVIFYFFDTLQIGGCRRAMKFRGVVNDSNNRLAVARVWVLPFKSFDGLPSCRYLFHSRQDLLARFELGIVNVRELLTIPLN